MTAYTCPLDTRRHGKDSSRMLSRRLIHINGSSGTNNQSEIIGPFMHDECMMIAMQAMGFLVVFGTSGMGFWSRFWKDTFWYLFADRFTRIVSRKK